jgi:hypothetical protein
VATYGSWCAIATLILGVRAGAVMGSILLEVMDGVCAKGVRGAS